MQLKRHRISTLPKAELKRAAISVVYPFNDAEVETPASFFSPFFSSKL